MQEVFLKGLKVFLSTVIVSIICFFVVISFNTLQVGLFTQDVGYKVYGQTSDKAEPEFLYKHLYADGDDTKAAEYEKEGYELLKYSIRSEVEKTPHLVGVVISQICCLIMLAAFIYNELWKIGNKDFEAFRIHGKSINKFKGFLIGVVAIVPSFLLLSFLILTKNYAWGNYPVAIFTFANSYVFEIILAITGKATHWSDINIWQALAFYSLLFIVPLFSYVSYTIGVKDISISEKLVYKNSNKKRRV